MKAASAVSSSRVEALVHAHQGALRGYLDFLGCPAQLLDDLVQETFLAFLSSRFEDRGERQTSSYLRAIARHLFLKGLRRRHIEPLAMDLSAAEEVWAETQECDGGEAYMEALRRCWEGLDGKVRRALELRYTSNLARVDIARSLGIGESGVHSILVRAKRRLRACIERRMER